MCFESAKRTGGRSDTTTIVGGCAKAPSEIRAPVVRQFVDTDNQPGFCIQRIASNGTSMSMFCPTCTRGYPLYTQNTTHTSKQAHKEFFLGGYYRLVQPIHISVEAPATTRSVNKHTLRTQFTIRHPGS